MYDNYQSELVRIDTIWVDRENRQRREFTIEDLIPTIRARGILQPLIVERNGKLVAGERRLTTALHLGHTHVPVVWKDNLSDEDRELIELEENTKRLDLTWQDNARATLRIHQLYQSRSGDEEWNTDKTAAVLSISPRHAERLIDLAEAIEEGDTSVANADTMSNAVTILTRRRARKSDAAIAAVMDLEANISFPTPAPQTATDAIPDAGATPQPETPERPPTATDAPAFTILNADVMDWWSSYSGPKFNLLHCDFPYGVELHGQAQQDNFEGGGYDSNPDIYWQLCRDLCANWDRIMYPSAHVVFWISMKFYTETIEFFEEHLPRLTFDRFPLIWHKTDNKGILPDAKRGGRNTYEVALFGSVGDRFIVKPVAKSYGAPTDKANSVHTNEKPEPMLRHFLTMVVDEHTRILDPTCGSGSAIRVAEDLGAQAGIGVEFNKDFADRAEQRLRTARSLRALSQKVS